jgi:hypothetical protein
MSKMSATLAKMPMLAVALVATGWLLAPAPRFLAANGFRMISKQDEEMTEVNGNEPQLMEIDEMPVRQPRKKSFMAKVCSFLSGSKKKKKKQLHLQQLGKEEQLQNVEFKPKQVELKQVDEEMNGGKQKQYTKRHGKQYKKQRFELKQVDEEMEGSEVGKHVEEKQHAGEKPHAVEKQMADDNHRSQKKQVHWFDEEMQGDENKQSDENKQMDEKKQPEQIPPKQNEKNENMIMSVNVIAAEKANAPENDANMAIVAEKDSSIKGDVSTKEKNQEENRNSTTNQKSITGPKFLNTNVRRPVVWKEVKRDGDTKGIKHDPKETNLNDNLAPFVRVPKPGASNTIPVLLHVINHACFVKFRDGTSGVCTAEYQIKRKNERREWVS